MQERLVAKKLDIKTLYTGQYVIQEGFNPNYIEIGGERISRVRILATVIDKFLSEDGNYGTITLDDGTDTIRAKAFQDLRIIEPIEKGDVVDVIGKIREYNEERYLQPEIIVKIEDPNFEVLRKLELRKMKFSPSPVPEIKEAREEPVKMQEPQMPVEEKAEEVPEVPPIEERMPEPAVVDEEKAVEEEKMPEINEPAPKKGGKKGKAKGSPEQKKLI